MKKGTTTKMKWTLILGLAVATLSLQVKAQVTIGTGSNIIFDDFDSNNAQDISKLPQMDRDIIILQNVLGDLFKNKTSSWRSSGKTKGLYVPGNGVIFNVGGNGLFFGSKYVTIDQLYGGVISTSVTVAPNKNLSEEDLDKLNEDKKNKIADQAKTFLADYGSLLGELKSNEKIQVSIDYSIHVKSASRKIDGLFAYVSSSRDENKRRMTAEITAGDLNAYTSGSISQNEVFSRIKTKAYDTSKDEKLDAKILAGIFDGMFKNTYDGYLSRRGSTSWTYFEGFGLMYNVKLSSRSNRLTLSVSEGNSVTTIEGESQKSEDFYKDIQAKYPAFEKSVKETMIKYGRTLRSLKSNEYLILNVGLSANKLSQLPSSIQFMIAKSEIDAFTKGNKSLDQVIEKITLRKLKASLGGASFFPSNIYSPSINNVYSGEIKNSFPTSDRIRQNIERENKLAFGRTTTTIKSN